VYICVHICDLLLGLVIMLWKAEIYGISVV